MANQPSSQSNLKAEIVKGLEEFKKEIVNQYADYCYRITIELDKEGKLKNPWASKKPATEYIKGFKLIDSQGLVFDGKHITWQSTGITFDYVAFKNKMLIAYPESKIDVQTILEKDVFSVSKQNGKVIYSHDITDPLADEKAIVGAYCVIKNNRGEFLTTLNKPEIEKHKKSAKTQYIWNAWFKEMVLKTVIKKACKMHFDDIYETIMEVDNENEDIEKGTEEINKEKNTDVVKKHIDKLNSFTELQAMAEYWASIPNELRALPELLELKNTLKEKLTVK